MTVRAVTVLALGAVLAGCTVTAASCRVPADAAYIECTLNLVSVDFR